MTPLECAVRKGHIETVHYLKNITKFDDVCNIIILFCVCVYILGRVACYNSGWGYYSYS